MRILLTNDDGIHAPGLAALERIARNLTDDVWIVAPETDQSGLAHSLTLNEPLRLRKIANQHFALKGTPTDCVIMGVRELMDSPPDLVLSGVNSGQNAADDVTYSGTVAGAMEGCLLGIRSIALSQAFTFAEGERSVPWQTAEAHAPDLIGKLMQCAIPERTLINVNFPNCLPDEVDGIEITGQGSYTHGLYMEKRHDGRGFPYYWLRFGRDVPEQKQGADIAALANRRISVTPLKLDLTHETFRAELAGLFRQ
ncbi:MAG: 5'/3'-nucleotidase SurE [Nitratireductor sp.]|nr:5'/3'-nucleotidase SurE [Nitratireductor sp.]MCB1459230.1 5'/3'-nucleotidase SurE [Nitratireductor sp.]